MARCSRVRVSSVLCVAVAAALVAAARATLMGVDLGTSYVKVSVARHGRGLELVTNEQAKRKTPSAVGFTEEGERLFGDAAIAYASKAPARAIIDGRRLVGKCDSPAVAPSLRCPREKVVIAGAGEFSGEHVVAMLLGMAKKQASVALDGIGIKDVVVSVPAWFDHHQRVAIEDAARVIGLNCLAVVNANTAAAVKYALDGKGIPKDEKGNIIPNPKKEKNGKRVQTVMFYDLGAGSATASIARIASDKKNGVASSVKMLGHAWEKDVGGKSWDEILVNRMIADFDKQRGPSASSVASDVKVRTRLRKEAQRIREVLSANTETVVAVPSLRDDVDFRTSISRADFETEAAPAFARAVAPAKKVLADAGLTMADIDAVVPFGGASRTPKVQEMLCKSLGIDTLNKSINSDEAAVMGNAFFAAMLSSTFRVRKMDIEDVFSGGVSAEIQRDEKSGGMFSGSKKPEPQKSVVVDSAKAKVPLKKTLTFRRKDDFFVDIFLDGEKQGWTGKAERTLFTRAKISGVAKVLKKLKNPDRAGTITPKVSMTVHVDRSGFVRVGAVESTVEEVIEVEREVKIKEDTKKGKAKEKASDGEGKDAPEAAKEEKENDADSGESGEGSDEKVADSEEKQSDDSASKEEDGGDADSEKKADANKLEKKKPKTRIEKSKQTLVHRHTLSVSYEDVEGSLFGARMGAAEVKLSQKILMDLESADTQRVLRADAFNSLEGFVLEVRSTVRGADEGDPLFSSSTEEEREAFVAVLDEAEDWMFTSDAKATENLKSKLISLKKEYSSMKLRMDEFENRPAAIDKFKEFLKSSTERVSLLRKLHAASSTPHSAVFDQVEKTISESEEWLVEKLAAQEKLSPADPPVLLTKDVDGKTETVARKLVAVIRLKLPENAFADLEKNETVGAASNGTESDANTTTTAVPETSSTETDAEGDVGSVDPNTGDLGASSDTHDEL